MMELTDFMMQHILLVQGDVLNMRFINIDSEINHIRSFIKIHLVIKGIKFLNLPSIFKVISVVSSIPTYFENLDSSNICFKYNKPTIRSTISNLNKSVAEPGIESSTVKPV